MSLLRFIISFVVFLAILILNVRSYTARSTGLPPAAYCGYPEQAATTDTAQALEIWGVAYGQYCWTVYAPVVAAQQAMAQPVTVKAKAFSSLFPAVEQEFFAAAEAGRAPDIIAVSLGQLVRWSDKGYLTPLDECRNQHPEFNDIIETLWSTQLWKGHIWGIPYSVNLSPLYFNKAKLQALGWSEQQIAELPEQIRTGQFTLEEMVSVAKLAIEAGIVQPGFGYWPHLHPIYSWQQVYLAFGGHIIDADEGKFVFNQQALTQAYAFHRRLITEGIMLPTFASTDANAWMNVNIWHDTVTAGRVLFWTTVDLDWGEWAFNYSVDRSDLSDPANPIGYALFPSAIRGRPGHALWDGTAYYAISSPKATGHTAQTAACALLAKALKPALNNLFLASTGSHTVLRSQRQGSMISTNRFAAETAYLWDYAQPNYRAVTAPYRFRSFPYTAIVTDHLIKAATGELPATVAGARAIQELRTRADNILIIQ